jgi:membrane-associated protease RseP (regulator of RpoE activity)
MLDGGKIFFVVVEIIRGGRRIAPEREALVTSSALWC